MKLWEKIRMIDSNKKYRKWLHVSEKKAPLQRKDVQQKVDVQENEKAPITNTGVGAQDHLSIPPGADADAASG